MTRPSHEWDASYQQQAPPPWDLGRPQPMVAAMAAEGRLAGDMLDAGCGTGEHSLLAAAGGARVFGVDLSEVAIERAREKAAQRGLSARFEAGDVLEIALPSAAFDVVLDSGLFHSFDDDGRVRYVDILRRVTRPGGLVYLMCFSDRQPGDWGPRRVTREELLAAFRDGWSIDSLEPSTFEIHPTMDVTQVEAWLLVARRTRAA
jgi:SAM-dependent methyltransferase